MSTDWPGLLPLFLLAGGGVVIFCAGAFWRAPEGVLFALALAGAAAAGAAALAAPPDFPTFRGMLDLGGYARYFTFLFAAITFLTILLVQRYARDRGFAGDEFYGLLLLAAAGLVLVAGALNWVIFFLGLELLSLSLYVLIAVRKGRMSSLEAGLKYFVMGAVASAFLTFGLALLYAMSGTLDLAGSLAAVLAYPQRLPVTLLALSLILVGIGFKTSLVPFHLWTPDVYQGAPAPVTAFLSAGSKVALFAALLRFSTLVAEPVWDYCLPALWVLAALTMIVGNLTALYQTSIKRLLAYSAVGQMGYLLMALPAVKQGALPALMFYLAVYALMDLGAFGMIGALSPAQADPDRDALADYRGLGYTQPWRAAVLAVCLLSLAGLPPTAGFMGKFALFRAVLQAGYPVLAGIGILTAILSIYYYFKVVAALYLQPSAGGLEAPPGAGSAVGLAGAAILVLLLGLGVWPGMLFGLVARLATALPRLS
jgi:NADH-quinone oxidoreductase subunit N